MVISNCSTKKRVVKLGGKIIGTFDKNTFVKSVIGSKHRLRQPPAWAIDARVFDNEVKPNATEILVFDKEAGLKYRTSIEEFDSLKKKLDRGFGKQYFLPIQYWTVEKSGEEKLIKGG